MEKMMKALLITICLLCLAGCKEEGNTGTVRLYARNIMGCGDGVNTAGYYYIGDNGTRLAIGGMRLPCLNPPLGLWYDLYDSSQVRGYCDKINLDYTSVTDEDGIMRIKGVRQSNCEEHPYSYPHRVAARFAMATNIKKTGDTAYWYGGQGPEFMWPNGNCPILHIEHIPLPKVSVQSNTALSAPTSGGASESAMASSGWDTVTIMTDMIDPNAVILPPYGFNKDVNIVRQYNTYARRETQTTASDSSNWSENYKHACPVKYEYLIACAYPTDLNGMTAEAYISSSLDTIEVNVEILKSNQDKTVWVASTDYFLPLTIEAYDSLMQDPNEHVIFDRWSDPNVVEVGDIPLHYLPLNDTDEIKIRLKEPIMSSSFWLSNNPTADLNGDGIVNLKDYTLMLTY
jgi:hypothetical protein